MRTQTSLPTVSAVSPSPDDSFVGTSIGRLSTMSSQELDDLAYGVIGTDPDGIVEVYNAVESRLAGLSLSRVVGQHLFTAVAPCMNNYLVAHRFDEEVELDDVVPYILTLRMRPTRVQLRLLRTADLTWRFLLIQR